MKKLMAMIVAFTCANAAQALDQPVVRLNEIAAPDTLITLQRGGCEQRCAVYRMVIFADGSVIYEGEHFVRKTGLIKSAVSSEVMAKLMSDIEAGGFFKLENDYGYSDTRANRCDSIDGDGPSAILSVSHQGRSKTILHNHRCVAAASKKLTELEDKVDRAVGTVQWIK